jgi:hypothetical protein
MQGHNKPSRRNSRISVCGVTLDVGVERVVVRLVEKIGLASALVAKRRKQPGESLSQVSEVDIALLNREFATEGRDGLAKLLVLGAYAADTAAEPGLRACDVGEKTVGFLGVSLLLDGRLIEDDQRSEDIAPPSRLPSRSRSAERGFKLMDGVEGSVLVHPPRAERVTLRRREMAWFSSACQAITPFASRTFQPQ